MTPFNPEPQASASAPPKVPGNPVMDKFLSALQTINGAQAVSPEPVMPPVSPAPVPMGLPPREGFSLGGDVGLGSWDATVSGPSAKDHFLNFNDALQKNFPQKKQQQGVGGGGSDPGAAMLAQQSSDLSNSLQKIMPQRQSFADGGSATDPWNMWSNEGSSVPEMKPYVSSPAMDEPMYAGVTDRGQAPQPASGGNFLSKIGDTITSIPQAFSDNWMQGGVYERDKYGNREAPNRLQDFGIIALGAAGPRWSNALKAAQGLRDERYKDMEAERAVAQLMGNFRGNSTLGGKTHALAAAMHPHDIAYKKAATAAQNQQVAHSIAMQPYDIAAKQALVDSTSQATSHSKSLSPYQVDQARIAAAAAQREFDAPKPNTFDLGPDHARFAYPRSADGTLKVNPDGTPAVVELARGGQKTSPSAAKAIDEADDFVAQTHTAIGALNEAKRLNSSAYSGIGAAERAAGVNNIPILNGTQSSNDTTNLSNVVVNQALQSLRATFGGNPTEGERKILMDVAGSVNLPTKVREEIYNRALIMAQQRLKINQQKAEALRSGNYYKPGGQPQAVDQPISLAPQKAALDEARAAITRGAPRDKVIERLRQNGINPEGL